MIGGDTYQHQVAIAESALHTHKHSQSTHICTHMAGSTIIHLCRDDNDEITDLMVTV